MLVSGSGNLKVKPFGNLYLQILKIQLIILNMATWRFEVITTWRIIPVIKWLITMVSKSPK